MKNTLYDYRSDNVLTRARCVQQDPVYALERDLSPVVTANESIPNAETMEVGHRRPLPLR